MPVRGCEPCRRFFFLDPDYSSRRFCPDCRQPLRLFDRPALQALTYRLRMVVDQQVSTAPGAPHRTQEGRYRCETVARLPSREIMRLDRTVDTATRWASQGFLVWGFVLLQIGLQRADVLETEQCAWGKDLRSRWLRACDSYVERYGGPLPD
jgi:hypothetical protein